MDAGLAATDMSRRDRELRELADALLDSGSGAHLVREFVERARAQGSRTLLTQRGTTYSGTQVADLVEATVDGFVAGGMQPGQVVLLGVRPGIEALSILLAALRIGVTCTVIDPGAGPDLFARRIALLRPDWVITESVLYAASARTPLRPLLRRRGLEIPRIADLEARHVRVGRWLPGVPRGARSFGSVVSAGRASIAQDLPPDPDPQVPVLVFFTSGTTAEPKGVQHTGRSASAAIAMMLAHFEVPADTVFYNHNLHSFIVAVLAGVPTVVAPLKYRPRRFAREATDARATHLFLRPVDAYNLVVACERDGHAFPPAVRQVYLYSAPVTAYVLERIHRRAHPDTRVTCIYGMTEAAAVVWVDSRERMAWAEDGDLVGTPMPEIEVAVDDDGQLLIKGPSLHAGYVGMEPTEWHPTGDLARLADDGSIVLMGRHKDMLIRGDFNLYPGLYEDTITRIHGVAACAIVGLPDARTDDEQVVLFVEHESAELAGSKVAEFERSVAAALRAGATRIDVKALPDRIVAVDALPRAGRARKIDRAALRAQAVELAQSVEAR